MPVPPNWSRISCTVRSSSSSGTSLPSLNWIGSSNSKRRNGLGMPNFLRRLANLLPRVGLVLREVADDLADHDGEVQMLVVEAHVGQQSFVEIPQHIGNLLRID